METLAKESRADMRWSPKLEDKARIHTTIGWFIDSMRTQEEANYLSKILGNYLTPDGQN